jgi:hypothetical protein
LHALAGRRHLGDLEQVGPKNHGQPLTNKFAKTVSAADASSIFALRFMHTGIVASLYMHQLSKANIFTAEEEVVGLHTQALPSSNLNDQLHHAQI